jgi:hypothetical protein
MTVTTKSKTPLLVFRPCAGMPAQFSRASFAGITGWLPKRHPASVIQ